MESHLAHALGSDGFAGADRHFKLACQLLEAIRGDAYWEGYLGGSVDCGRARFAIHLAVFVEPFLGYVLDGRKTVESRFSARRIPPYQRVASGDVLLMKRAGGPIVGLCRVVDVWFYQLDPASWRFIKAEFTAALCAQDPAFWLKRQSASFVSLMRIDHVRAISPLTFSKRDRRGWVILTSAPVRQSSFVL